MGRAWPKGQSAPTPARRLQSAAWVPATPSTPTSRGRRRSPPRSTATPPPGTRTRERVFARTWQWLGDLADVEAPRLARAAHAAARAASTSRCCSRAMPAGTLRCLSNVCTHRGNLLVREPCRASEIRCGYHSRRFDLAGRMTFMPEFEGARDFPSPGRRPAAGRARRLGGPRVRRARAGGAVRRVHGRRDAARSPRCRSTSCALDPARDRDYEVARALGALRRELPRGLPHPVRASGPERGGRLRQLRDELHRLSNVQVALARGATDAFAPARPGAEPVAAHYWWVFPNLMLNVYPWGLSVNLVQPLAPDRTRVAFRSYVWDASRLDRGAGGALDRVEREDEAIVEAVQRGVRARLYRGGPLLADARAAACTTSTGCCASSSTRLTATRSHERARPRRARPRDTRARLRPRLVPRRPGGDRHARRGGRRRAGADADGRRQEPLLPGAGAAARRLRGGRLAADRADAGPGRRARAARRARGVPQLVAVGARGARPSSARSRRASSTSSTSRPSAC